MPRVGVIFSPYPHPPEELCAAAEAADASGVHELWLWEDCFRQSAFAAAGAALARTERLHVGIGIAPMPLRNVAATAMEIATIERMFPGRLLPGVGHGVLPWMGQVGARVASPLTLMREYLPALKALLAGDEVTTTGRYVTLDHVRLDWPPVTPPRVFAAGEGPKTLALTGEVADGTVLVAGHTIDEVAAWVSTARGARSAAGRDDDHEIVAYLMTAFGGDAEARIAAEYRMFTGETPADVALRAAAGSVDGVAEVVRAYARIGVDHVALQPTADADLAEFSLQAGEVARLVA